MSCVRNGSGIDAVVTELKSGRQAWRAKVFGDATGEGDLAAPAGYGYGSGWNSDAVCRPMTFMALVAVRNLNAIAPFGKKEDDMIHAGEFKHIYDPSVGEKERWYINDHCFIRGQDGHWHMFGITHAEPAAPLDERFLAHATSPQLLDAPWQKHAHVMHADLAAGETHVWAPHIIRHDGLYWMYYCAGGVRHDQYRIHLAVSEDLWRWRRHGGNPMVVDGFDARDPMILRVGDVWVMYYTGNSEPSGGYHVVYAVTSNDLVQWNNRREVFRHFKIGTYGGPTESPFVVNRQERYYLFVCANEPYSNTAVYAGRDPFHWDIEDQIGSIGAHAAEVVEEDEQAFVSRAGWGEGGLYLAELEWNSDS